MKNCIAKHPIVFTWIYTQKIVRILETIFQGKKLLRIYFLCGTLLTELISTTHRIEQNVPPLGASEQHSKLPETFNIFIIDYITFP